ncbi:MAG: MBL fold metallo-hydrolase [Phycisphaerae bacterium]|nr:MBL fold metallo-hydrolase [Phycisphaerae bacterium]
MRVIALQSGSNGNAIYVEACGTRLLLDAGISGKQAALRLAAAGRDIRDVDALLISHDHRDHARCCGIYQRKFGLPIWVTHPTLAAAGANCSLGRLGAVHPFRAGEAMTFGTVRVETVPTPHDAVDGVGFVIDDGTARLGILTDLGHAFDALADVVATLDAALVESNYDPHMLETGPYPYGLKRRIRGPGGHLSNVEAAELLAAAGRKLRWACIGHLSEDNNAPDLALDVHRAAAGGRYVVHHAGRYSATDVMTV